MSNIIKSKDSHWYNNTNDRPTAKKELTIDLDDIVDDNEIDDYGSAANRKIDNKLFPFKDQIPTQNQDVTAELKAAAILYIAFRYKLKKKSFDVAKEYKTEFTEIIDDVIARYKASPELRTKRVVATTQYKTNRLFSQQKRY